MKRLLCRLIGHNWFGYPIYGYNLVTVVARQRVCWRCDFVEEEQPVPLSEPTVTTMNSSKNVTIHYSPQTG